MKKTFLILTAIVLGIVACNNEEPTPAKNSSNQSISSVSYSIPSRIVSDQFIDSLADFHNEYMTTVINLYDFNAISHNAEMREGFESIGLSILNLSQSLIDSLLTNPANDYSYICSQVSDPDVQLVMDTVKNYITSNPNCNFSEISNLVTSQETYTRTNIIGSDLDICLTFLKTFEKSSYLWLSVSNGGLGLGDTFIDNLDEDDLDDIPTAINWSLIAWADGAGAARRLYFVWVAAAGGPIGWGAAASVIGWAAAYASGATLIGQLLLT